jgi:hypothetical protein
MSRKVIGIAGHAGIGHVNGVAGFIQDDSAGFITVGSMIADLLHADTRIRETQADVDANTITITTMDGGTCTTSPRRGITPAEAKLIEGIVGQDTLFCQSVAVNCLGRMFGQGVLETPVALQAALANAIVDTFHTKAPDTFIMAKENVRGNGGLMGGLTVPFEDENETTLSYLITVNYTRGGLGPAEDLEGNVALGSKRGLMEALEMLQCPTIIVEGKAYLPAISDQLDRNNFLVRAQRGIDNQIVARALLESAQELGYPVIFRDDLLPHAEGAMKQATEAFAEQVIGCAERLKAAERAPEKVALVAELARLISEDAGAVTCLSSPIHDVVRGTGNVPGTAAVLSMLVSRSHYKHWKIPLFGPEDAEQARKIINLAVGKIALNYAAACSELDEHYVDIRLLESVLTPIPPPPTPPQWMPDLPSRTFGFNTHRRDAEQPGKPPCLPCLRGEIHPPPIPSLRWEGDSYPLSLPGRGLG